MVCQTGQTFLSTRLKRARKSLACKWPAHWASARKLKWPPCNNMSLKKGWARIPVRSLLQEASREHVSPSSHCHTLWRQVRWPQTRRHEGCRGRDSTNQPPVAHSVIMLHAPHPANGVARAHRIQWSRTQRQSLLLGRAGCGASHDMMAIPKAIILEIEHWIPLIATLNPSKLQDRQH